MNFLKDFMKNDSMKIVLVILGLFLLACIYEKYIRTPEQFETTIDASPIDISEPDTQLSTGFDGLSNAQLKQGCFPIDKELTSEDLLPNNDFAAWSEAHPSDKGVLEDKNFLHAGHHIGINTIGQSLRNPNYNLRSEPPNPQMQVSPWSQTTIGPDMTRRPMEIGSCS